MTTDVFLQAMGLVCALGNGHASVRRRLFDAAAPDPLSMSDAFSPGQRLPLGIVDTELPDAQAWPEVHRTRTNALAAAALVPMQTALDAAIARFGPRRVAVVVGGSTAGVREGEVAAAARQAGGHWPAGYSYAQQELGATAAFVAWRLGVRGPVHVVSSACASGAKALVSAARLLRAGLADAVIAGGADALCRFTVAGFGALESVSRQPSRPLSATRDGINLGEGAALFLMGRDPGPVRLAGWGEAGEAYHMSAPTPDGRGARRVMQQALERAGCPASAVDYINLHGTATRQNDAMEALAVAELFGSAVPVSSTKPLTGHTLAAAGAIEAAFCWLTLTDNPLGALPQHRWDGQHDPALPPLHIVGTGATLGRPPRLVLSNSFAFGGSNAALLLGQG